MLRGRAGQPARRVRGMLIAADVLDWWQAAQPWGGLALAALLVAALLWLDRRR